MKAPAGAFNKEKTLVGTFSEYFVPRNPLPPDLYPPYDGVQGVSGHLAGQQQPRALGPLQLQTPPVVVEDDLRGGVDKLDIELRIY